MADKFRKQYRELTQKEKNAIEAIKIAAEALDKKLENATQDFFNADPRAISLARTNLEQTVMWATKAITG